MALQLYDKQFDSRLLLETAAYPNPKVLRAAVRKAQPAMITVALHRQVASSAEHGQGLWGFVTGAGFAYSSQYRRLSECGRGGDYGTDGARSI